MFKTSQPQAELQQSSFGDHQKTPPSGETQQRLQCVIGIFHPIQLVIDSDKSIRDFFRKREHLRMSLSTNDIMSMALAFSVRHCDDHTDPSSQHLWAIEPCESTMRSKHQVLAMSLDTQGQRRLFFWPPSSTTRPQVRYLSAAQQHDKRTSAGGLIANVSNELHH
jgi:hypothetical protein